MGTTLGKATPGYGYKYTELADINKYLESQGITYYQFIEPIDGVDYIYTVPIINGEEQHSRRGCRVIEVPVTTKDGRAKTNVAQSMGSGITYARRYSLLMAFGLATEDDDAACMTEEAKKEEPKTKKVEKVKGEVVKETPKDEEIPGYPDREEMMKVVKKHYPEGSDALNLLLGAAQVEKLDDLSDAKLAAIWNKYGGR
jgi:hypothetical protein